MSSTLSINRQYLSRVNDNVAKLVAARRVHPGRYVDQVLIPQHERDLQTLSLWRSQQIQRVTGFAAKVPKAVSQAFNQAYASKLAEINAIATSSAASAKEKHAKEVSDTNAQLKQLERDTDTKLKQANRLKDKTSASMLRAAINQARQSARASNDTSKTVYNQTLAQIKATQQSSVRDLNTQYTTMLNQSTQYNPPAGGTGGPPSSNRPGATYVYDPTTNSYIPTDQVVFTSSQPQVQQQPVFVTSSQPAYDGPPLESYQPLPGQPDAMDDGFDFFDFLFGWMSGPSDYNAAVPPANPSAAIAPVGPGTPIYDQPPQENQLDVFETDPWSFGFGANPMGSRTIRLINKLPILPPKSFGFGQWGAIAGAIIQAGAQIGASAATAALAPKPRSDNSAALLQMQLAQAQAQQQQSSNLVPLAIGGGVALLVLVLVLNRKK